jgi:hypothetical protein
MTRYGCVAVFLAAGLTWGAGPATVKSPEVRLCEKARVHWHAGALVHWIQVRGCEGGRTGEEVGGTAGR